MRTTRTWYMWHLLRVKRSSQGVDYSAACVLACHAYRWQRRSELSFLAASNTKHTQDMKAADSTVPRAHREIKLSPSDEIRFWKKVDKNGPTQPHMTAPCWVWTASKAVGYGRFRVGNHLIKAHRIVWVIHHGQIPHDGSYHGLCVCHRCDNPACCNPSHLFLGTSNDNNHDKEVKGRGNHVKGDNHYSRTHPERLARGEANKLSKLTAEKVIKIRSIYGDGALSCHQLGVLFGVTDSVINKVIRYKLWKHV